MNVEEYLSRIKLRREEPTLEFLRRLQYQHLLHIPFENLTIQYGGRIVLDLERIFRKIVPSKRGGYCYELNGLFHWLLTELGFTCEMHQAQFHLGDDKFSPEFDHMTIVVSLDGTSYLSDVGLRSSYSLPKKIKETSVEMDSGLYYRFICDVNDQWMLQKSKDAANFETLYRISDTEVGLVQFIDRNDQHQDREDSHFVRNKMVSKMTPTGRITLTDHKLTVLEAGTKTEISILNEDAFLSNLSQYFGIDSEALDLSK